MEKVRKLDSLIAQKNQVHRDFKNSLLVREAQNYETEKDSVI